jgi:biopolymer transport protein ExbB
VFPGDIQAGLTGQLHFLGGGGGHVGQRVAIEVFGDGDATHVRQRAGTAESFQEAVRAAIQRGELEQLDDQQGPGEHRATTIGRAEAAVSAVQSGLAKRLSGGQQFLASTGSGAPFIGLFGTVYGIMNSFIGIANTNTTNLAVVAPGIAEALLATGIGLFAAIPATIFYNYFSTRISAFGTRADQFGTELLNAISRQLDKGA